MSTVLDTRRDRLQAASQKTSLRDMQLQDVPKVHAIETAVFPSAWPVNAYHMELTRNHFAHYSVLEHEGTLIGFAGMWVIDRESHITTIGVDTGYQGSGFGRLLFLLQIGRAFAFNAKCITLEVRPSNTKAVALYESAGLSVIGRRRGYYNDNGEDALIMWSGHIHRPAFKDGFIADYSVCSVAGMSPVPSREFIQ